MMFRRQQGFSLVTAIFLLVVLAGLLGYMINLSTVQHSTVVMSVQGARAMQAARSALDYGIFQALDSGCGAVAGSVGFTSDEPALDLFAVQLQCNQSNHIEGPQTVTVYELTATASLGNYTRGGQANPDFVSRQIRVTVSDSPS